MNGQMFDSSKYTILKFEYRAIRMNLLCIFEVFYKQCVYSGWRCVFCEKFEIAAKMDWI